MLEYLDKNQGRYGVLLEEVELNKIIERYLGEYESFRP